MIKTIVLAAVVALMCGCSGDPVSEQSEQSEAEGIYWHEHNRYSAAIISGDSINLHKIPSGNGKVSLFSDVRGDDRPWYKCMWVTNRFKGPHGHVCEIHIKDIGSLRTADWNHGKFGTGTTSRID